MSDERFERNSRSRSRESEELAQYPLKISISQDMVAHFNDPEMINKIKNDSGVTKIAIQQNIDSSSYVDAIINVSCSTTSYKLAALSMFIEQISMLSSGDKIQIDIFVPESRLQSLMNNYGPHLSGLNRTNALMSVQKRVNGLRDRPIRLSGKLSDVKDSAFAVYKSVFEKRHSPRRSENPSFRVTIPGDLASELSNRHSSLYKKLRTDYCIDFSMRDSKAPLKESESVVTLLGRSENCQDAVKEILNRVHEFSESFKLIFDLDSMQSGSNLIREIKDRVAELDVWTEKYPDGRLMILSGSRRAKMDALKVIFSRSDRGSERPRRSPERRSPRRESPRRESPKRATKQSSINITIPETLVARLIGKNGENIKNIMNKSNSNITFQKQEQNDIKTPDGGPARICTLKGTPTSIADGLKILLDQVISLSKH